MYVSAANSRGSYGCQIWVHRSVRFRFFSQVTVSPRLLVVSVYAQLQKIKVHFVSAHAPHEMDSPRAKDEFWSGLRTLFTRLEADRKASLYLAIDANARVGSFVSASVGCAEAVKENANGELFRLFLQEFSLVAVNTFHQAGYTWRSAWGPTARIDYVVIPSRHLADVIQCDVPKDVDLTLGRDEDHRCVRASLQVTIEENGGNDDKVNKTRCMVNKSSLSDQWLCEKFQRAMWCFTAPDGISLDGHVDAWNDHMRRHGVRIFGKPVDKTRKPWISSLPCMVIKWIAPLRRQMFKVKGIIAAQILRGYWLAWRATLAQTFPCEQHHQNHHRGWVAVAHLRVQDHAILRPCWIEAAMYACMRHSQNLAAGMVVIDRDMFHGFRSLENRLHHPLMQNR